jgi:molybdopterin/thiamine biosynthesis adenylyltransferase
MTPSYGDISLTESQIERYSRQIILGNFGAKGVKKLLMSTVAVVGAGGLGCPALQVLAGAGVGHLKIIDHDAVALSNLPRQILHSTNDLEKPKVESAKERLLAMNPDIDIQIFTDYLNVQNIAAFLSGTDYVIEASDNLATKFLVNDACVHFGVPFTIAGVLQYGGQVLSVQPGKSTCYRCLFGSPLNSSQLENCSTAGILATTSIIGGTIQANEAIKTLLGLEGRLLNTLLTFDLGSYKFIPVKISQNPQCQTCKDPSHAYYKDAQYTLEAPVCGQKLEKEE